MFAVLQNLMEERQLPWDQMVGFCTDGAPSMAGRRAGLRTLIMDVSPSAIWTHCMIHREQLAAKELSMVLADVLQQNARGPRGGYCHLNVHMPLLRMYFDGGDTKRDFRLARVTLNLRIQTLEEDNTLGWGKTLEVLVFLYWLASATFYRVV
ncbi:hypothetical protein SKAU_G00061550 [Synaphobranchus kaupii]|uniref:Uncharacterized protein n=1 Tax=Synaphobranchus kaupii TaxID=118154 RepID=A0A9Q1G6G2_SYNKA|nr:hypothetical protein SKAU_G00061550 [Synaphobranchus kaupii]